MNVEHPSEEHPDCLPLFENSIANKLSFLARNSSMIGASGASAMATLPSQTMRMAVVVFIVLPIACAYPFFQRYVVAGLTIGSVKG